MDNIWYGVGFLILGAIFIFLLKKYFTKKFRPMLESFDCPVTESNNLFNPWDYRVLSFEYKNRPFSLQFAGRNSFALKFGVKLNSACNNVLLGESIKDQTGQTKYVAYNLLKNTYLCTLRDNKNISKEDLKLLLDDLLSQAIEFDSKHKR